MKLVASVAAAIAIASIGAWTTAIPAPAVQEHPAAIGSPSPVGPDTVALALSAARLRSRDPFRLERKPADVRYNPWGTIAASAPAPAPSRPALALVGLVGGPPWNALLEGVPGRETGMLLQLGDSAAGIRFVALRGDTVVLAGFDTTWSLAARREWH